MTSTSGAPSRSRGGIPFGKFLLGLIAGLTLTLAFGGGALLAYQGQYEDRVHPGGEGVDGEGLVDQAHAGLQVLAPDELFAAVARDEVNLRQLQAAIRAVVAPEAALPATEPEVVARAPRLLLHAATLRLHHPYNGALLCFTAPLPFL